MREERVQGGAAMVGGKTGKRAPTGVIRRWKRAGTGGYWHWRTTETGEGDSDSAQGGWEARLSGCHGFEEGPQHEFFEVQ
jgi:hypothetical protein